MMLNYPGYEDPAERVKRELEQEERENPFDNWILDTMVVIAAIILIAGVFAHLGGAYVR